MDITVPYAPRRAFMPFHEKTQRWSCIVSHRRAGKTVACINELIRAALTTTKKEARFAYIAPQYAQAKDIAWSYIKQFTYSIPNVSFNESELRCDFPNGARIRLYGTENESRLRGLYLDGVILDEYADIHPKVFDEILRPLLADRQGWAVFVGTPMGHNQFYTVYQKSIGQFLNPDGSLFDNKDWFSMFLDGEKTGILNEDELAALKREMTPEAYNQEIRCDFEAAIKGAVYGKEMKLAEEEQRICKVPYDPSTEVWVSWDIGIGDQMVLWFAQQIGREVRVIDLYAARGAGIDHYVKILKEKPYVYARHILPHDAGKSDPGTGLTFEQTLRGFGIRNTRILKKLGIEEGIGATRRFIPKCVFDVKRCNEGIEALKMYRYEWDDAMQRNSKRPLHDWASDYADSFRYMAMGFKPEYSQDKPINYPNLAIP